MTTSTTDAEAIARVIENAMQDAWNDICDDTGCHPLDLERRSGHLTFRPGHWSRAVGQHAATAILSYLASRREAALPHFPENLHPQTVDLVKRFAVALAKKLRLAEEKYGYGDNWSNDRWENDCREHLYRHLEKGDPRDVAAYCAFMWHHGWITSRPDSGEFVSRREAQEPVAWRVTYADGGTVYLHHKPTGDSGVYECTPLYTAPPAPTAEVERPTPNERFIPRMLLLDDLHAVCVGGRWDGWKFYRHPDGQWVSLERLKEESAALNGGRSDD